MISDERLRKVWEFTTKTICEIEDGSMDAEKADAKLRDILSEPEADCPADCEEHETCKTEVGCAEVAQRGGCLYVFAEHADPAGRPLEDLSEKEMIMACCLAVDYRQGRILKNRYGPTQPEEGEDQEGEELRQAMIRNAIATLSDVAQAVTSNRGTAMQNAARVEAAKVLLQFHGRTR